MLRGAEAAAGTSESSDYYLLFVAKANYFHIAKSCIFYLTYKYVKLDFSVGEKKNSFCPDLCLGKFLFQSPSASPL